MLFILEISRPIQWKPKLTKWGIMWLWFLFEWRFNVMHHQYRAIHVAAGIALERGTSGWKPNEEEWKLIQKYIPVMEQKENSDG